MAISTPTITVTVTGTAPDKTTTIAGLESVIEGGFSNLISQLGAMAERDTVGTTDIDLAAVTGARIAAGAVATGNIATSAVTTDKLGAGAVTNAKLAQNAVATDNILDSAVTNAKIGLLSVGTGNLIDASVTAAKLGSAAVQSANIANDAVTAAKIAAGNVVTAALGDGAVTSAKIANDAVVASKIADSQINTLKLVDGAVTNDKIENLTITGSKMAAATVTNNKLADVAANTIKGRGNAGTGSPTDMTPEQAKVVLSLDNVDNTSDANKPVSTAQAIAIALKADQTEVDPLTARVKTITTEDAAVITDQNSKVLQEFKSDGGTKVVDLEIANGSKLTYSDNNTGVSYTDSKGVVYQEANTDGSVGIADAYIKRQFKGTWDKTGGNWQIYDVNHVIWYGQSYSIGSDGVPVISTTQNYNTLSFNANAVGDTIRQQYSVAEDATALQSFVPAVEVQVTGSPEFPSTEQGETGAVAFADYINYLIEEENNINYTEHNWQLLLSAPGEGSKTIEELSDDTDIYYQRLQEQITRGYAVAQAAGKTYAVSAITWMQGTNAVGGAGYAAQLEALRSAVDTYAKSVTGQTHDVKMIVWQLPPASNTGTEYSAGGVYTRFVEAADTYPHIYCSGPAYQYNRVSASNVHFVPNGQRGIGRDMGLAYKRAIIDGLDYKPLKPQSLYRQGSVAMLKLNPDYKLVSDTAQTATIDDLGFNLYQSDGTTPITITSASIVSTDTIKIVASTTIPSDAILRYADIGTNYAKATKWRGNVRDVGRYAHGQDRWLVAFEYTFDN